MKPLDIIKKYYPESSDAYRILVTHSRSVADKALALARLHPEMNLDLTFIEEAAMLHDTGRISRCGTGRFRSSIMASESPVPVCLSQTKAWRGYPSFRIKSAPR